MDKHEEFPAKVDEQSVGAKCPSCGTFYLRGEDARIDAGLECGFCHYSQGDTV